MATKAERRAAYEQRQREREVAGREQVGSFDRTLERGKHAKEAKISDALFGLRLGEGTTVRTRRMRRSVSRWARFQGWWWYIPFTSGMAMIPLTRLFAGLDSLSMVSAVIIFVAGPLVVGTLGALFWSIGASNREVTAERAWLEALPYEVVDYEECLGDEPRLNDGQVELAFTFEDAIPTKQDLAPFLASDSDGNWELSSDGRIAKMIPGPCGANDGNNQRFAVWFHHVADERLVGIHARFPLLSVRLRNERWHEAERGL
jgi:hypothetical protein